MPYTIRLARVDDQPSIASFTQDTFDWGDYIADVFDEWVDDPAGRVVVAVDADDVAVGMVKLTMLSPDEAWAHGARVHPDHRRRGLSVAMHADLTQWARKQGAKVCRLFVEEGNSVAEQQVESLGFRVEGMWFYAALEEVATEPVTAGNGGKRKGREPLAPAAAADVPAIFISWSDTELYRTARGMATRGWTCARLTDARLVEAAKRRAVFDGSLGSVLLDEDEDLTWVSWINTDPDNAAALVRALIAVAAKRGTTTLRAMLPDVPWLRPAFDDAGFSTTREFLYSQPLL